MTLFTMTTTKVTFLFVFLFILKAFGQSCSVLPFEFYYSVDAPLDTITFDNLGTNVPWNSSTTTLRITPESSMAVNITGINDGTNFVRIDNGTTDISGGTGISAYWIKSDFYAKLSSSNNAATVTFASPIRQFSVFVGQSGGCYNAGTLPQITLLDNEGALIACAQFNLPPSRNTVNDGISWRYRGTTANIKSIMFSGCILLFDNLSFKIDPCFPNPCNSVLESCFDAGKDAACCPKNSTWNGVKCITGNICIDSPPCDSRATCASLRTGGYTCTCGLKFTGTGTPGNCFAIPSAPLNITYNIAPVLECIDQNNVAQFGYISNETSVLLIDGLSRNNLEPINTSPVVVFRPGRSLPYPLNPGQVLLNVTSNVYAWRFQNYSLEFANDPKLACPTYISIVLNFAIGATVSPTLFGQQVLSAFIFATSVQSNRVTLVNVTTASVSVNKRSMMQQDLTELEVELSVAPPTNNTEPSAAEVVRDFVSNQQDDLQYDLNQNNPNVTISVSVVTTKAAPIANPPIVTPQVPLASETPSASESPSQSPSSFIASSAPITRFCCLLVMFSSLLSLL